MALIKIPIKPGSSNKTETHTKTGDPAPLIGSGASHQSSSPLVPFIDKLSIVVKPGSSYEAAQIHQAFIGSLDDPSFLTDTSPLKGFKIGKRLNLTGIRHRPTFHYSYHGQEATKFRLEFNPSKLGLTGLTVLNGQLKSLMNDGWEYVIGNGILTRVDIAVDLPGIRMDDLHFLPPQKTMRKEWSTKGRLETVYFGSKKSSQTVMYNKKAQQIAVGKGWEGPTLVRIERRLKGLGSQKLSGLPALKNPFGGVELLQGLPGPSSGIKENDWSMFSDSVRCRGLDNALALLPAATKARYRKYLKSNKAPWWDAASIWGNWDSYLALMPLHDKTYFSALP